MYSVPFYAGPEAELDRHEGKDVEVSTGEDGEGDKDKEEGEKSGVYDEQKGGVEGGAGLEDLGEKGHCGPGTRLLTNILTENGTDNVRVTAAQIPGSPSMLRCCRG